MPDGHGFCEFDTSDQSTDEDWSEAHCEDCAYYFESRSETSDVSHVTDANGNPAYEIKYESCCPSYEEGISSVCFPCKAGYDGPDSEWSDYDGPMPPMAYAIDCNPRDGAVVYSYAWMQRLSLATMQATTTLRSINVFDDFRVCWGNENSEPRSLPEAVETYCDAKANGDLLKPRDFVQNATMIRGAATHRNIPGIQIPAGYDAALLVSATHHLSAYLLMRGSGMPAKDGFIAAGLRHHVHTEDDREYAGFITDPDDHDHCWFFVRQPVTENQAVHEFLGLLLSQIPNPYPQCSSTTPSSSEPAALVAS